MKFSFTFLLLLVCCITTKAQIGKVGINTTTPLAMLHVKDSSVLFTGAATLPVTPGNPPVSGAGTRMMWYPDKAAFRVGQVTDLSWDKDSIGNHSFASGFNTKAKGENSTAMGSFTNASGLRATAMGINTTASGDFGATAMGSNTTASGDFGATATGSNTIASGRGSFASGENSIASSSGSVAMGESTNATGYSSTAFGSATTSSGGGATAMGSGTTASGTSSTAMGSFTNASGNRSTAMGFDTYSKAYASLSIGQFNDSISSSSKTTWVATDPVFIIGNGTADNARSNAFTVLKNAKTGINTSTPLAMLHVKDSSVLFTGAATLPATPGNPPVSGAGTRMMWYPDKAAFRVGGVTNLNWDKDSIGNYSFAAGVNTRAIGSASIAMGSNTTASGDFGSTALGYHTIASGNFGSTAFGSGTIASGNFGSTAFGSGTNAIGTSSIAMGDLTNAIGTSSTAMGTGTNAIGARSTAMGLDTYSKAYASLTIGQYNDSIASSTTNGWVATDPVFIIGNGTADNTRNNAFTILKNAKTGINTEAPKAMLHVVRTAPSGGSFHSSAAAIIESSGTSYLQLSGPNASETGILSGNTSSTMRSAIIFRADSSLAFRAGGNTTQMAIDVDGNTNIEGKINRSQTGIANIVPIAYGSIGSSGVINSGTGNFTMIKASTGTYDITITGETYTTAGFTTSVTPITFAGGVPLAVTGFNGTKLRILVYNMVGVGLVDCPFSFVVFKQ
ncbi:MAG: hypothetical protein ABIO79_13280 [Ferruginibacter sp.]